MGCCLSCGANIVLKIRFLSLAKVGFWRSKSTVKYKPFPVYNCLTEFSVRTSALVQMIPESGVGSFRSLIFIIQAQVLCHLGTAMIYCISHCPNHISIWKTSIIRMLLTAQIFLYFLSQVPYKVHYVHLLALQNIVMRYVSKKSQSTAQRPRLSLRLPMSPMWTNVWDKSP